METQEIIKQLEVLKSLIEWDLPIDYQIVIDEVIRKLLGNCDTIYQKEGDTLDRECFNKIISKNLKSKLIEKNMKQVELCKKSGLCVVTMSRYVNGERIPTVYNLYKISKALGCSIDELISE